MLACAIARADPDPPQQKKPPDAEIEKHKPEPKRFGKLASALTTGAIYSAFGVYAYFAWFYGKEQVPFYVISDWGQENPFALHSYAGGADKWGHAWSNYALTRGTTELLAEGGWDKFRASVAAGGLSVAWFTVSELKDGVTVGFEVGDEAMNVAGAALGVVMENVPELDRRFDFRMAYWPSSTYLHLADQMPFKHNGGLDIGQDYTGQSYLLAYHLRTLPRSIVDSPAAWWCHYTDLVVGFETRHYSPVEVPQQYPRTQTFYVGVTLDLQAVLGALLPRSGLRTFGDGLFEVYAIPNSTVRFAEAHRYWNGQ